ncbi:DUF4190 domain-containing protein [Streptomyces sp. NBC_00083]|uniref:DUF4190 domain-containing protein n=1 Tax=Streptomyces sp. NBC_00083 TaxID=2975647 RepID=UPI0022588AF1|nr:DUF4190 domain-containing protein [Streptomyces sp. NBC_00083]MCX5385410.1 DUF4190 domain-containing protein [Streptomyces sp. NBC_00083]
MEIPPPPAPGQPQEPQPGQGFGWPTPPQAPGAPGPYPGQPMNGGPWYPYPMAPQRPPVSGLAVASLVTGILCCIPPLGLVLGALGLRRIKKEGQRGKGLAIAGIALSTVGTVLLVISIVTGGLSGGWRDFKDGWNSSTASGSSRSTLNLRKGDCFDVPGGKLEREVVSVRIVPCAGKHDAEVSGSFRVPGDSAYPGQDTIAAQADARCLDLEQAYAMDRWKVPAEADPYYYTPSRQSWSMGDHTVTCAFASQGAQLEGSVRNDAATLDPDQIAFLKAADAVESAMAKAPDADRVEDDLSGFRQWAGRTARAMDAQTRELDAYSWQPGSRTAVQPYIAGLKVAQKEWAKAAVATDANDFYMHSGAADAAQKQADEITARGALGLATTPPSTDSGSDGGSGDSGGSSGSDGSDGSDGGSGDGSGTGGSKSV